MAKKRNKLEIIADMLRSLQDRGKLKPTHLMYKANLSHGQMHSYLEELLGKEFVSRTDRSGYEYLIITDKGSAFLQRLRELQEFQDTFGL